jgi:hypothetical protein
MGHHARTLTALVAVLGTTLVVAASAAATVTIRVETPTAPGGFVPATVVTPTDAPVPVTNAAGNASFTCAGKSVAGLLSAATHGNWLPTDASLDAASLAIRSIGAATPPPNAADPSHAPKWVAYVNGNLSSDLCGAALDGPDGAVLLYPWCNGGRSTGATGCFTGGPLWLAPLTDLSFQGTLNVGINVYVNFSAYASPAPDGTGGGGVQGGVKGPTAAILTADNGDSTRTDDPNNYGVGSLRYPDRGPGHSVTLTGNDPRTSATRVPDRMDICATDGGDGFCGTTRDVGSAFDVDSYPSPCTTNGHDGFCGTTDTSGPVTHVSNITPKKVFKRKRGPGQVKGTIDLDPNGVGRVSLRLTRSVTTRVLVKTRKRSRSRKKAKKRYRTVKRCTVWNDTTALLQPVKRCGTKYAAWFPADIADLRNAFSYSFAMTLPAGTYTLEVSATDEDGHLDAPAPGRNVLTFTVK